jgi:hypothetical protein
MTYPRGDYWTSQTPEFREYYLALLVDAERAVANRERARKDRAHEALANIKGAVETWEWIPERGDVLEYVSQGGIS